MTGTRPTRWQKARADWPGFQWRDVIVGGVGLVVALVVLQVSDFPGDTVAEVAIVGGSAIVAALLYSLMQLVWAWLQAPMRLLTEDVIAIRERLEGVSDSTEVKAPTNVRLTLLNYARMNQAMFGGGYSRKEYEVWLSGVVAFLTEHLKESDVELFLRETAPGAHRRLLQVFAERY